MYTGVSIVQVILLKGAVGMLGANKLSKEEINRILGCSSLYLHRVQERVLKDFEKSLEENESYNRGVKGKVRNSGIDKVGMDITNVMLFISLSFSMYISEFGLDKFKSKVRYKGQNIQAAKEMMEEVLAHGKIFH